MLTPEAKGGNFERVSVVEINPTRSYLCPSVLITVPKWYMAWMVGMKLQKALSLDRSEIIKDLRSGSDHMKRLWFVSL